MLTIVLFGLVAACAAAPRFPPGPPPYHAPPQGPPFGHHHYSPFADELFDTRQFWAEMANEMRQLDTMLSEFYQKFPAVSSTQGVEGNEYKVTIPLSGFDEKEIVVKARAGLLMVQAVHKLEEGGERSYLDIKTLPSCVNVTGTWTFQEGVLKIVFPLKPEETEEKSSETTALSETEETVTESYSREEVGGASEHDDADADVGVRGDQERENQINTNEIPRNTVEATTYAVDLKDEVEFVPIRYNK